MKKVAIIGAGPAGIEAASVLARNGIEVTLFEKSETPLKNIQDKAFLFPNFQAAQEIADDLNFASASFFGRYAKEHLGMTPMEYRRKYQNEG